MVIYMVGPRRLVSRAQQAEGLELDGKLRVVMVWNMFRFIES